MLRLTDQLGRDVIDAIGAKVGVLRDVTVALRSPYPAVTGILVKRGRHVMPIEWSAVDRFGQPDLLLRVHGGEIAGEDPGDDELLLRRDLLDAQIVDLEGKRLVRVGDVELSDEDSDTRLIGVDVGAGSLLRRLGLGVLSRRFRREPVDWASIHIVSMRGHSVQLRADRGLDTRTSAQLAELIARIPPSHAARVLSHVDPKRTGEAIAALPVSVAAATLRNLDQRDREATMSSLPPKMADEVRDLLEHRTPARRRHRSRFGKVLSARRHAPS